MRRYELFPGHMLVTPAETIVEINDVSDNYNGQLLLYSDIPATAAFEIPYFAADLFGLGPATILPFLDFRGIDSQFHEILGLIHEPCAKHLCIVGFHIVEFLMSFWMQR